MSDVAASTAADAWNDGTVTNVTKGRGDSDLQLCLAGGECWIDVSTQPDGTGTIVSASFDGSGCCNCNCPGVDAEVVAQLKALGKDAPLAGTAVVAEAQKSFAHAVGNAFAKGTIDKVWAEDFVNFRMLAPDATPA